jgi:hypothetical protein
MPITLKRWCLDPLTFEECLRYERGEAVERVMTPRKLPQLEKLITGICYIQGGYLVTGYRGVGKTSFVNYALARAYKQLAEQEPPCILIPVFLNLARNYDVGKLLRRTIRQLYRTIAETYIEEGAQRKTLYSVLPPGLQRDLTNAYLKTSARVSEATTDALKTVIAETTTREWNVGGEVSGEYSLLPDPLPAKVGAKLAGGYSAARSSSRSEETAKETVNSLEYLEYDDEIAEDELMRLIGRLVDKPLELQWEESQSIVRSPQWFWRLWGKVRRRDYLTQSVSHKGIKRLRLVFVYDELDKVEPQEAQKMLNALKPLLLSSKATFIFIGGYEFAHQWLARTQPEGDMPYGLFSDVIYVPLYTDSELNQLIESLFPIPPDGGDEDSQALLDHVRLHCGGTPREFFRQLLQFVQWRDRQAFFDTCQKEALFSRLLPYVQEVNSKISSALPQEVRDELTRRTYEWLMMAEREATFSLSVLFTRPEISGMWQRALSEHFKKFCDIMVEGGVFQPIESETEEQYCFNPEFSLGTWRRPTAVSPAPEELRGPVLSLGPFETPPGAAYFVDRETELRTIRQALETGIPLIQVVGMAGIGKTALVTRIAHDMRNRFPDGVLWISLEPGMTLENVLHHIALSYGKVLASAESEILAAQVRALLADKKALIVLDAAENLSEDTLEQILPGTRNCSMIVTTRTRFPKLERLGQTITLDVLSPDASISLLKQSAGYRRVSSDRDAALKVCQILGHHPLAIEVAGRLALSRNWTMQSLLNNLQSPVLGSSEAVDPLSSVTRALHVSYESLSDEEKRVLMAAAIFAEDFDPTKLAYVVAQPEGTTAYHLDNLVNRSLILRSTGQSYRLHPLVRAYVRHVTEEIALQEMRRRHAQYFLKWVRAERRGK